MLKMLKENIKWIITIVLLVIACFIVIAVEYSMFIETAPLSVPFITPTTIGDTALSTPKSIYKSKTSIPIVKTPITNEILIGKYFDDFSPSLKYTTIIKLINGKYYKTDIFSDGSQGTKIWNVKIVNGEERLFEEGDDGYFGEYMIIERDRSIAFYDKQGFIYRLYPK